MTTPSKPEMLHCDAFGCGETHPIDHELLGEECFGTGRWLGWVYLDLNRPDLFPRELRFCSVSCCQWWLDREIVTRHRQPLSPLDQAIRSPNDAVARKRALQYLDGATDGSKNMASVLSRTINQTWAAQP